MATTGRRKRTRGEVEELPSGALRVRVYAGIDPVTHKRHYLTETVPAGPDAARLAEHARTRLLSQVDERRNPSTKATVSQLLDRWLEVLDVEVTTRRAYVIYIERHIRPVLGQVQVARLDVEAIESFYAALRKCRLRCRGKRFTEHRTTREHTCDERCRPHKCKGLSDSTVRQIHWILSGALAKAVRWKWIAINPTEIADKPALPHPDPDPPSAADAARLINAAWKNPDWGALVWLAMTTGARRGELCGLRWSQVDLDKAVLTYRKGIAQDGTEVWEKDTKTHQKRRIALDPDTVEILRDHRTRWQNRLTKLDARPDPEAYVFSLTPDGSEPMKPSTVTQKYARMAAKLKIDTNLHALRHYSATELIAAGVDVRTVAGRLGHGGGGATTLRVYTAWLSESDQRAALALTKRLSRPGVSRQPTD